MPWLAPTGTPDQPPMTDSHIACWHSARAARSVGWRCTRGSPSASISIAWRETASEKACGSVEHHRSAAWSSARMPEESSNSDGVSSVAAGSRITARGTTQGSSARYFRPAARSV